MDSATTSSVSTAASAAGASGGLAGILGANPYFSAGFGLIGVTASLAVLRQGAIRGVTLAKRRLLVTLEIPSKDHAYPWFLQWMANRGARGNAHQLAVETSFVRRDNGSVASHFELVPGPGRHFFRYQGAWFQIERQRERNMIDLKSGTPWETITLTTLSRDRPLLLKMLEEAKQSALSKEEGRTVIYTSFGPEWRPFGNPRKRRPLESVVLAPGLSQKIVSDVKNFLEGGKWYQDRGIPYRRGYLLYGPPGSGKTSYILALAGELEYNICVLNLSERGMTDDRLSHLLNHAPPRSIILLEDVDAAFNNRMQNDKAGGGYSPLTFSGLLNALDGVASSEERLIFMTTNHLPRLDPALIRPGRVDLKLYIGNVTSVQAKEMFLRFYEGEQELAERFVGRLEDIRQQGREVSPAALQGHFVLWREDAKGAVENVDSLVKEPEAAEGAPQYQP
ncbi:hypothetical protein HDU85_000328 [Gaertneriomyces sp. JEL0708]|nr:hypothetical protein HDU85_000328 [Gaertneriomyces sp. JEL0708]